MSTSCPNMHGHAHVCALANTCGPTCTHAKRKHTRKENGVKATSSSLCSPQKDRQSLFVSTISFSKSPAHQQAGIWGII